MTLQDTCERALPMHRAQSLKDYLVYLKHLALYKFVSGHTAWKGVRDWGCGEGWERCARTHRAFRRRGGSRCGCRRTRAAEVRTRQSGVRHLRRAIFAIPRREFCDGRIEVIGHIPSVRRYLEEIVRDDYALALPRDLAPGDYRIEVGPYQYPALTRLIVKDASGIRLGNRLLLGETITVAQ